MLRRIVKSLALQNRLFYSTQQKKNVIIVPKRYEVTYAQFSQLQTYIQTSQSCKVLSVLIKENLQIVTDYHITAIFNQIARNDLQIDDNFHTVIAPIAVQWIKNFNRDQAPTLGSILLALTFRNIISPQLEQSVVKKLDQQHIYRYLDLTQTVALFTSLSKHRRFLNHSLLTKLQNVIYQQKSYYGHYPQLLQSINQGLSNLQTIKKEETLSISQAHKQIV